MMPTSPPSISFEIIEHGTHHPPKTGGWSARLKRDRWDDWGKYCTQFYLTLFDPRGEKHGIGLVKIGERGLKPHGASADLPHGHRKPNLPSGFEVLDDDFFSVGQDDEYYANLADRGDDVREQVLKCLRDVAFDKNRWDWARDEDVMDGSLLRFLTPSTVEGQFRRMAHGNARLTRFDFSYSPPKRLGDGTPPFALDFSVDPESPVPTNVHVLIGRNGVGKTLLLSLMSKALIAPDASARQSGKFEFDDVEGDSENFSNVVVVSFSAFDEVDLVPDRKPSPDALGFSSIGLRGSTNDSAGASIKLKAPAGLARDFVDSLSECKMGARRRRWEGAIAMLQSDPVFQAAGLSSMITMDLSDARQRSEVFKIFTALSSGHKIVLLTLTRLVEKVEEKTLVLIDELEAHLHPPLLSAMTRAISELMVKRNGVAIVATHSPVVLQEVPKSCVWILNRVATASKAERPSIETFAESIGILSREVFQLELSQSGYHRLLGKLKEEWASYEDALEVVGGHLGAEGRAVLKGLYLNDSE